MDRRVPIDVEERIRQRKLKEAAAAKPRFIPKKERERMATEKKAKEEQELKSSAPAAIPKPRSTTYRNGTVNRTPAAIPTGPKAMRHDHDRLHRDREPARAPRKAGRADERNKKRSYDEMEAEEIRLRYLGPRKDQSTFTTRKKKKNKDKFNFDWDPSEDTSRPEDKDGGRTAEPLDDVERTKQLIAEKRAFAATIKQKDPENGALRARQVLEWADMRERYLNRKSGGKKWSDKSLDEMKERDWRIFKENFGIATKGGAIPNPMRSWEESDLPPKILDTISHVGYKEPTPIQRAAIPIALQARDLIGVAVTGSGKTAAFLLPLLVYISDLPSLTEVSKNDGPYALILAPTRELVQQIEAEARRFATPLGFTCVSIVGGHSLEEQAFALRNGAEIIVATPGRLVDCIERRLLVLEQCCYIIMDEADRMIDLGFEESVNKILDALPVTNEKPDTEEAEDSRLMSRQLSFKDKYRQTMMYTATMPPLVEKIAKKYLRRPATVMIGNAGEAVETVEQRVEFVAGEDKRKKRLHEILASDHYQPPIIVFVNIKRNCEMVARDIKRMGFSTVTLHSDKTQDQREAALASLRQGHINVLVATDLAGRGIDVPDVSLVVNFNMAPSIEAYTHRIGRTGRAGKSGVAITFLGTEDKKVLYDLKQMLSKSSISKVPEDLKRHPDAMQRYVPGGGNKRDEGGGGGFNKGGKGGW
ncbi:uncharacterized protein MKZ38_002824 [Zalerion maritima]|uniref:RNA helicase n=1 Tax=Zalerion maritima TaxID=339359 RepID=A0AAD5RV32_9PEZI|nr:uncharacterized protein MKZ38_002824 [Zalerion maritima]